jgi:nucleotide-binding universal stress UspA family protein
MIALKSILVAIDFSEASESALTYGRALARTFGAELHVLHVIENPFLRAVVADPAALEAAARRRLSDRLAADNPGVRNVRAVIEKSDEPADAIVSYAKLEAIDLIVMGTRGRTGAARMFVGSVAERVVRLAPCPVLTVRHPEREFVAVDALSSVQIAAV